MSYTRLNPDEASYTGTAYDLVARRYGKVVTVRFYAGNTSWPANSTTESGQVLPVGFRPQENMVGACGNAQGVAAEMIVQTDGKVEIYNPPGSAITYVRGSVAYIVA